MFDEKLNDEKEAFFAAYWGQEVIVFEHGERIIEMRPTSIQYAMSGEGWLQLRPFFSMTDEEATEIAVENLGPSIQGRSPRILRTEHYIAVKFYDMNPHSGSVTSWNVKIYPDGRSESEMRRTVALDQLRKMRILMPFRQYLPENILAMGWAKYRVTDES